MWPRNVLQHLRRVLKALRNDNPLAKYEPLADSEDYWTDEDSEVLRNFFAGSTGAKLKQRLANAVYRSAIQACSEPEHGDYNRGLARGVFLTVQLVDSHQPQISQVTAHSDDSESIEGSPLDLVDSAI